MKTCSRFWVVAFAFILLGCHGEISVEKHPRYQISNHWFSPSPWQLRGEDKIPYTVLIFKDRSKKRPLIFAFHASGSTAKDYLKVWEDEAIKRGYQLLLITRRKPFDGSPKMIAETLQLLDSVIKKYGVKRDEVYLAGDSSGNVAVQYLMAAHPERWRKAVMISSPEFRQWARAIVPDTSPPLLIVHSEGDPFFNITEIRESAEILNSRHVQNVLQVEKLPVHGHQSIWNVKIFDWLEEPDQS